METIEVILSEVMSHKARSAWDKGVRMYAVDLLNDAREGYCIIDINASLRDWDSLETLLLNGAHDWKQFSDGGCALIYNCDIAERLCTPSELKRTNNGRKFPNDDENWIDVQTRALYQAADLIHTVYNWIV